MPWQQLVWALGQHGGSATAYRSQCMVVSAACTAGYAGHLWEQPDQAVQCHYHCERRPPCEPSPLPAPAPNMAWLTLRVCFGGSATTIRASNTPAQILYSLSERHAHRDLQPSDISQYDVGMCIGGALKLVMDHAAHLPRFHRKQAAQRDTALLLVSLPLTQRPPCTPVPSLALSWQHG